VQTNVRPAGASDAGLLAQLSTSTAAQDWPGLLPLDRASAASVEGQTRRWRQLLDEGLSVLLAELGGRPAGFAVAGPARDPDLPNSTAELYAFYLDSSAGGYGLAQRLWEALPDQMAAAGHRRLVLWVDERNTRMRALVGQAGFQADGRTRAAPNDQAGAHQARHLVLLPDAAFAAGLARALDERRWTDVARFLDANCRMEHGQAVHRSGEASVDAWMRSADGGRRSFEHWSQERSVVELSAGRFTMKVATRLEVGVHRHVHRIEEVINLPSDRCVQRVQLREPPGERQRLQAFLARLR
jgi:GNAT superfamily N-acetyltransferase